MKPEIRKRNHGVAPRRPPPRGGGSIPASDFRGRDDFTPSGREKAAAEQWGKL
jgi:hypothetical protein